MQLAGTVLVASFFLRRFTAKANGEFGWSALAAGLLLLCGSSLLGVLWAGAAILLLGWFVWREEVTLHRGDWTGLAFCLAPLAGLGAYYRCSVLQPRELASYGKTGLGNVIFALYELFGLSGLGPGRDSIRAMGLSAFEPYGVLLVLAAFTLCGLVLAGLFRLRREHRHLFWPLTVAWIAPITGTFALGTLGHVSVLGRHLTPALPALLLLMGWTLARLWANSRVRALTCVTLVPFLFSSGMLRLAERHTKTDARAGLAAAEPIIAANDTLWWVGDRELPWYYSSSIGRVPNAILVIHPSANDIAALPAPAAIFLLRPDVFDQRGAAQDYIRARNYRREREWNTLSLWRATQPAPN